MDASTTFEYAYKAALIINPVLVVLVGQRVKAYHLDVNGRMTKLIEVLEQKASDAFQAGRDSGAAIDPAVTAKAAADVLETARAKADLPPPGAGG